MKISQFFTFFSKSVKKSLKTKKNQEILGYTRLFRHFFDTNGPFFDLSNIYPGWMMRWMIFRPLSKWMILFSMDDRYPLSQKRKKVKKGMKNLDFLIKKLSKKPNRS